MSSDQAASTPRSMLSAVQAVTRPLHPAATEASPSRLHDYDDPTTTLRSERGIYLLKSAGRGTLSTSAQSYPLTEATEAHRRLQQNGVRGVVSGPRDALHG